MEKRIKTKLLVLAAFLSILGSMNLYSQENQDVLKTIHGQLLNEEGEPLPGTIITAFLSGDKCIVDSDGNYTIDVRAAEPDELIINKKGYQLKIVKLNLDQEEVAISLERDLALSEENSYNIPYRTVKGYQDVSGMYSISGDELESYPTASFLDALSGLLPGVYVESQTSQPGQETQVLTIRGEEAVVYVDGVIRDPADLSAFEIDKVQVLMNLPGRAMLGIYGSNPVLWITTKTGISYNRQIRFSAEYGVNMATTLPAYTDAYDYALLFNEALENDGYSPYYSEEALNAYRDDTDPVHYPNINYLNDYVKESSPFRKVDMSFAGGDQNVNYFSLFSYAGSGGLEGMGETYNNNRYKLRGNVNFQIADWISMNVNISGTHRTGRNPLINVFQTINQLPANAHPIKLDSAYIISSDYRANIENSLLNGGFNETSYLGTQNNASLNLDLSRITPGLSARAYVAFDAASLLNNYKSETAALYRLIQSASGGDSIELVQEEVVTPNLSVGDNFIMRKTVLNGTVNYFRAFDEHEVFADLIYYQGAFVENAFEGYQPELIQDFSLRTGYSFRKKYTVQLEQTLSGSMRLPAGDRMSYFPTVGLGWILSKEDFLADNQNLNFLKLNFSVGSMGLNDFGLAGYNSYYLYQTLWETSGSWVSGLPSRLGTTSTVYAISQEGSADYSLPKKSYLNAGLQGSLFGNSLSFDVNYYRIRLYDIISQKISQIPSLIGGGQFLPAGNYGENRYSGVDGMIQYTKTVGDFNITASVNGLYKRGKYVVVDEPLLQEDYRKYTGKQIDEYVLYNALGLFQDQAEIDNREVDQTFGELKPGDIIYEDYNDDQVVDEKDMYRTGAHAPRVYYGAKLALEYKGFGILLVGQGAADGEVLVNNSYFTGTGTDQNFSQLMTDRWPVTNDIPRLTTNSENNMQNSTFWLKNGTYFRLKNVQVSYSLPSKAALTMGMKKFTIFLRASNVLTFSDLSEYGVDPENHLAGIMMYPIYKTYTAGLSCNF